MCPGAVMSKPSSSFQVGDVITGEPHLYIANPSALADSLVESPAAEPAKPNLLKRCFAAVQRPFRVGPTPDESLARALNKAFTP
jgi:hypothetical protein